VNIQELKDHFQSIKKYEAQDVNELLDFVKKCYIYNEITTCEYRNLVYELETLGAKTPELESSL
jgi:hypothetical protein